MELFNMKRYLDILNPGEIDAIHNTSLRILAEIGIGFPDQEALEIFKGHGFQVDGKTVYFTEKQITAALQSVPDQFTLQARNPERNVTIGQGRPVFAPGYGAPFLIDPEHGKKVPGMQDYEDLVKLAQALPHQDMSGHLLVEPQDLPSQLAHLYMLRANLLLSDKPFIGSTEGKTGAVHTLDLIRILFGGGAKEYYTLGLINPLSPLRYSKDMLEAVQVYAKANQPLVFACLIMAGSTGPITLPGMIAQQNAELLAGITLAQLIQPGLPVIYGSTSTNIDMKTGALAIGSPELSLCLAIHAQLARKYLLPSRGGGALTDSSVLDAQAGYESMFSLLTTINSGIDFILHSAGIISSYLAFSLEKFVMDDELCGMVKRYYSGVEVNQETLAFDVIQAVGQKGHFLSQPHTVKRCRSEFWMPELSDRSGLEAWWDGDRFDTTRRAAERAKKLLSEYQQPELDQLVEKQILAYIAEKEQNLAA
jgi:trimethylamine--corrinoid protein Co-methyltransferase